MKKGRRRILQASLSLLPGVTPLMSAAEAHSPAPSTNAKDTGDFIVKPYLQYGNPKTPAAGDSLVLMWHTEDMESTWAVETRGSSDRTWSQVQGITARLIAVPTIQPHRVFRAQLTSLQAGSTFEYRVLKEGRQAFTARGKAPKASHQSCRIAVLLDVGINSPGQKAVAYQIYQAQP